MGKQTDNPRGDMSKQIDDIEIEQLVRVLCAKANHFTISTYNGGVNVYAAWMGATVDGIALRIGEGPTLREALRSAVEYMAALAKAAPQRGG